MDSQESPVKGWQLDNLATRVAYLERQQDKEDKAKAWFWRSVAIVALTFIFQVIALAIGVYVFRRQG